MPKEAAFPSLVSAGSIELSVPKMARHTPPATGSPMNQAGTMFCLTHEACAPADDDRPDRRAVTSSAVIVPSHTQSPRLDCTTGVPAPFPRLRVAFTLATGWIGHGVSAPAGRSFARFCAVFQESVKKIRCQLAAAGGSGHSRPVPGFTPRVRSRADYDGGERRGARSPP